MHSNRSATCIVLTFITVIMTCLLFGASSLIAEQKSDLLKELEKKISSVQRRIVTDPSRAEKEIIEAREIFQRVKESSPNNQKLTALEKRIESLQKKLEKKTRALDRGER